MHAAAFRRAALSLALAASAACDRPTKAVEVELYMMAKCPFGSQLASELAQAVAPLEEHVNLRVSHIGKSADGKLESARGEEDVQAGKLQVCADALGTAAQARKFLACEAAQYQLLPAAWESCAKEASLDVSALRSCAEGRQGRELLSASFARSGASKVEESPTLVINGQRYTGGRHRYAVAESICAALGEQAPEACAKRAAPPEVRVRVITDARCKSDCDLSAFRALLEHEVPGAKLRELDVRSEEGRTLFEAAERRHLPIAVFPMVWKPTAQLGQQIAPHLRALASGDGLSFPIGHRYDPRAELCDNQVDDDSNGMADCADEQCRHRLACREEKPNRVDVFVLMGDAFSHRGVEAAHHALAKQAFEVAVHPIGRAADAKSAGASSAVLEGTRLECAQAHGLAGDDVLLYALCRQQRAGDPNWQGCLPAEIDREAVQACVAGEQGTTLLRDAYRASEQLAIERAPYVLVNNRHPLERYAPDAIVAALCQHNPGRKGCTEPRP